MVALKVADEAGFARTFWNKFKKESMMAIYAPFLVCLASGRLYSGDFRDFIAQDVLIYNAFAQVYEMAEGNVDDDDDDDRLAICRLRKGALEKIKLHADVAREWGFELPEESNSNNTSVKYIEFLFAAATGKVEGVGIPGDISTPFEKTKLPAYTLAAIAPFFRLYEFISKDIKAVIDPDDATYMYKKWVESYSSRSLEACALQIEETLDQLCICLTTEELEVIEKLYHRAVKLEVDFFAAQPHIGQTIVPLCRMHDTDERQLVIFCDFEKTCTAIDSSAFLSQVAIVEAQKADSDRNTADTSLVRMSSVDLRNSWGLLSSLYGEEYEQYLESIISSNTGEFDYEGLCTSLDQYSDFEKKANIRVEESGVLKGLYMEDIERAGRLLSLQDGCKRFLGNITKKLMIDVHVLSFGWSGDLIRAAFSSGDLDAVTVHANELAYKESISTGKLIKILESPMEKLQAFNDSLRASSNEKKSLSVYIGGTVGDLLCLLEADIGIVIGSSSGVRKLGDQFGISFVPLFSGLVKKQKEFSSAEASSWNWKGQQAGILYTVSDWAEIHAFILGSQ